MADADQSRLARTYIECSFNVARMRERRPTNDACGPIIGVTIGEQSLVFCSVIRRVNRHGTVDPSRRELRHQVVRLKGTPKRLERGTACVRRYVHPRRLIGTVGPEVLMCIDDETHRMPPRVRNAPCGLCVPKIRFLFVMETAPRAAMRPRRRAA